jgi:hypothetical protein
MRIESIFDLMLENKSKFTQARKGSEFEDRFEDTCKQAGFTRKLSSDVLSELKKIKENILDDFNDKPVINIFNDKTNMIDFFVLQPFGSQSYPDFLIFTKKFIIPIEIKYSSEGSKKPMWNGNIPKANGIYIFGNNSYQDFTFFKGIDILPNNEKEKLFKFWEETTENYIQYRANSIKLLKDKKLEIEYGFDVYPRKTFQQNRQINNLAILNFFNNPKRGFLEKSVLDYLGKIDE